MRRFFVLLSLVPVGTLPGLAFAQTQGGGVNPAALSAIRDLIIGFINAFATPILLAIAFVIFLYGIATSYILSAGDPEAVKKGHQFILWGVIGFVLILAVWGVVNLVAGTFGLIPGGGPTNYGITAPQL